MMNKSPVTNWAGNINFKTSRVHHPASVDELQSLVALCQNIRAIGSAHSFSQVLGGARDLAQLDGLPKTLRIDEHASTVTVAAGMRYVDIAPALYRAGFALANLASLPHISVAGACTTGTHGSGDGQLCLSAAVSSLWIIGPEGDITRIRREENGDSFDGSVVTLGALGIVSHLELDLEPAYDMAQSVRVGVPLDEVADRLDEVFGAAYSVSVFTDWQCDKAQVWCKYRADRALSEWQGGRAASRPLNPVPGMPPEFSTEQLGVVGPWYERLPHFRPELTPGAGKEYQSEFYVPRAFAPHAIAAIQRIGHVVAPVLHIAEMRTVGGDELWLSPAYGRDSVTFHFTWIRDIDLITPALAAVEEALMPLGARPHWAKITTVRGEELLSGYERSSDFKSLIELCDPKRKFSNAFLENLVPAA